MRDVIIKEGFEKVFEDMHNRKKLDRPLTLNESKAIHEKSLMYRSLVDILFAKREEHDYSQNSLLILGKMLRLNPDFYSLWNFRREILLHLYPEIGQIDSSSKILKFNNADVSRTELEVTADGIRKNPKSYCAWNHRLWIVSRFVVDLNEELALCKEFLKADQRNFHCWNYRRHVHELSHHPFEQEIEYSKEKILENFSNYSAFHHRSVYLSELFEQRPEALKPILEQEFSIVESAIFTEPDDQSAWWYLQFLCRFSIISWSSEDKSRFRPEQLLEILLGLLELVHSLLELEQFKSRWAMNSNVYLIDLLLSTNSFLSILKNSDQYAALIQRRREYLQQLIDRDPAHENRYLYLLHKQADLESS